MSECTHKDIYVMGFINQYERFECQVCGKMLPLDYFSKAQAESEESK